MATYYWVGGTGTWDNANTTNWSLTSGGAGGAAVPNSSDTVIFDSASGTGTCTTASGSACAIATLDSSTLGLTLGANHTMSGTFTLTSGTLSLGTYTLTCSAFSSNNSNTRSIAFGTGNVSVTGTGAVWTTATATGFSVTGTPVLNLTSLSGTTTRSINMGPAGEANAISLNVTGGSYPLNLGTSNGAYKNINFTGFSGTLNLSNSIQCYGDFTLSSTMTVTSGTQLLSFLATGKTQTVTTNGVLFDRPLTFNGVGSTFQLQDNLTIGDTRTVTLTNGTLDLNNNTLSCGLFSSSNSNTRSIAFGTGNITLTGNNAVIWSMTTSTGFTYTGTPTVNATYSGATGTRSISTSGIVESNAVDINVTAGTDSVSISSFRNINLTGFSGTLNNSTRNIFGNLTLSSGMTVNAGTAVTTFAATSGTQQITTNGKTLDFPITFNGVGGTWSFADALTQGSTRAFTITNGTVKLKAGVTSTVGAFATSGSNQKYLQSTTAGSQATLSQASGTVTVSYLSIKDIAATGGATWNAYVDYNNVDQGDNTGWDFSYSPAIDNEFPVALRSFTQPKRF